MTTPEHEIESVCHGDDPDCEACDGLGWIIVADDHDR